MEEEKIASEWLMFLGKMIKKIDDKMEKEGKNKISTKILAKEILKTNDIIKIVSAIFRRYLIYLNEDERRKLNFALRGSPTDLFAGLNKLEKEKKINICIFLGYTMGE